MQDVTTNQFLQETSKCYADDESGFIVSDTETPLAVMCDIAQREDVTAESLLS